MAIFKNASGQTLDTSKYTNLEGQDAVNWASGQSLFKGYSLVDTAPANTPAAPATPIAQPTKIDTTIDANALKTSQPNLANQIVTPTSSLSINNLLNSQAVKQDKGVNGTNMASWIQGNASLIPQLANNGYTLQDIINEAYAQTRYNKSAFAGDMMITSADANRALNQSQGYNPSVKTDTNIKNDGTEVGTDQLANQNKSISDQLNELLNSKFDRQAAFEETGFQAKSELVNKITGEKNQLKQELDKLNLDNVIADTGIKKAYYENKELAEGQRIPMTEINKQLTKLSEVANEAMDKLDISNALNVAMKTYQYNSKLIELSVAQGDLQVAQNMVTQLAQDFKDFNTQKLNILQMQNTINQQDKELYQKEIDREYEMATNGYTYIQSPSALQELAKQKGLKWVQENTINIAGKIYIKPDETNTVKSTIQSNGHLYGINSKGDIIKDYGRSGDYNFNVQDDGSVIVTNPSTGEVIRNEQPITANLSIGSGTITGMNGSDKWSNGLDFVLAGGKGAEVKSPFIGEVVYAGKNGGFGNQVKIKTISGEEVWLSHLDSINVKVGQQVNEEMVVGTQGNTGDVYSLTGGDGTHLDITMKKSDGSFYGPSEVAQMLGYTGSNSSAAQKALALFNGTSTMKLTDIPTKERAAVDAELARLKQEALAQGNIEGVIRASAGGGSPSDTFIQSFEKAVNVVYQIHDLQTSVEKEATGPIWGIIRSNNPYDTKAQLIKAQLQSIVPNLARGIYGEVGVLTDNDIKNYSQTLPNLKNVEEARNMILAATIRSVQRSIENKIRVAAGLGKDVSGIMDVYSNVKSVADNLESQVSSGSANSTPFVIQTEQGEIDLNSFYK